MTRALRTPAPARPVARAAGRRRIMVLALISAAQLMISLDSTIVSVALPSIQHSIGLSSTGRQWSVTAYTLAFGGLLLLGGRLGDPIGWWQARAASPLLPLRILAHRDSAAAFLCFVIAALCTYGMLLGMTYQFQEVMGYSPARAGLAFLAYVATAALWSALVAGRVARHVRPGLMIACGLLLFAGALLLLTGLGPGTTFARVLPTLLMFGVGVGTITVPAISTVVTVADPRDRGIVSAIVNCAQQAGASVGASGLNTVSVGAASVFLAAHRSEPDVAARSAAHGLAAAAQCSAAVAVVGALFAAVAIRVAPAASTAGKN